MKNVNFILAPEKEAMAVGKDASTHILARIQVVENPELEEQQVPMNVALVIDCSGSMQGQPLEEAKKSAAMIVRSLRAIDRVSVIAFSSEVKVVCPIQNVNDKEGIVRAIELIRVDGMTNLHGGWLEGVAQLTQVHREGEFSRVMLLSDGKANRGERDKDKLADQCRKMADAGITTSTYGLGQHFSEYLMKLMAEAGLGKSYYGELAEDLQDAFESEMSLLQCTFANKVTLKIKPRLKGTTLEVLNPYEQVSKNGYRLTSLAWGAETWVMINVKNKKSLESLKGSVGEVLEAEIAFQTLDGINHKKSVSLSLPVVDAIDHLPADQVVEQRLRELRVSEITKQAQQYAQTGDWRAVERLIDQSEALVEGDEWLEETLRSLRNLARRKNREQFSKEAFYKSGTLSSRHVMIRESAEYSIDDELHKAAFLRRKTAEGKRL